MIRVGTGFDIHPFAHGRRLVLGGVSIPYRAGLGGHSDADVLCHAIADAILGGIAAGDIGNHFSDKDMKWRGMSSLIILRKAVDLAKEAGAEICNIDSTVLAEEPKIAPHITAMRKTIAETVGIPVGRVSVKATTMEAMGAIGRREGIAAMAVACLDCREL